MLAENLAKVLNLIRKTGDRVIVFDSSGQPFVLMNLDEYQRLVEQRESVADLTEDELLDKINRDIAVWKTKEQDNSEAVSLPGELPEEQEFASHAEDIEEKMEKSRLGWIGEEDEFDWDEEEDTYYFEKV